MRVGEPALREMTRVTWNYKRRLLIQERLRTVDVCVTGFWFCLGCQQISEPEAGGRFNCAICGSPRLRHHLPIMSPEEANRISDLRFAIPQPAGVSAGPAAGRTHECRIAA